MYTNHSACLSLLNTPHPTGKLARSALTIQEINLTLKHRSGRQNVNADALSRNPQMITLNQVNMFWRLVLLNQFRVFARLTPLSQVHMSPHLVILVKFYVVTVSSILFSLWLLVKQSLMTVVASLYCLMDVCVTIL